MNIEEIIRSLEDHACLLDQMRHVQGQDDEKGFADTLREAAALLKTNQESKRNEPLTLKELRKMEGQPVWTVTKGISDPGRWELVIGAECEDRLEMADGAEGNYEIETDSYGKTWLAYRRPPKEE